MKRFGYNAAGFYVGPLKMRHRHRKSLALRCLQDGTLDVCLLTGHVYSYARGEMRRVRTRLDEDGYEKFTLSREVSGRERRKTDSTGRRRRMMTVFVHRLVMMKKIAVALGESHWREKVVDLPGDQEVHHRDKVRRHNQARNLTLESDQDHKAIHAETQGIFT